MLFRTDYRVLVEKGRLRRKSSGKLNYSGWVENGLKGVAESAGAIAAVKLRQRRGVDFFYPRTTTLVEVTIDRLPAPADAQSPLVGFPDLAERVAARKVDAEAAAAAAKARQEAEREARLAELEEVLQRPS